MLERGGGESPPRENGPRNFKVGQVQNGPLPRINPRANWEGALMIPARGTRPSIFAARTIRREHTERRGSAKKATVAAFNLPGSGIDHPSSSKKAARGALGGV
jgi:hypothetical protein